MRKLASIRKVKEVEKNTLPNGNISEGIVFKSMDYIDNEIVSFKVINNQYLLNKKH
jgi:hypothetical protein